MKSLPISGVCVSFGFFSAQGLVPRKRRLQSFVALLALLGLAGWWVNGRLRGPAQESKPFRVGFQNSPPYNYPGPSGSAEGVAVEIVSEASKRRHIPIEWVYVPEGPDTSLGSGKVDLWPLVAEFPERKKLLYFSDPWLTMSVWLVSLESSVISTPKDAVGHQVWHDDRNITTRLAAKNLPGAHLTSHPSNEGVLEAVCTGRADAGLIWGSSAHTDVLRHVTACGNAQLRFHPLPDGNLLFGIGATYKRPGADRAADAIRAEIGNLVRDGTVSSIYFRLFLDPSNEATIVYYLREAQERNLYMRIAVFLLGIVVALLAWQTIRVRAAKRALAAANAALGVQVADRTAELTETNERLRLEITERKRTEETLRESEQRFRGIFEGAPIGISILSIDGQETVANRALQKLLNCSAEELSCLDTFNAVTHPDDQLADAVLHKELREGKRDRYQQEKRYILRDGRLVKANVYFSLLRDSAGRPKYALALSEDITERKQSEQALRQAEEKYRSIFENAMEGIFQSTPEGRFLSVNPALAQMYGYANPDEMICSVTDIARQLYVQPELRNAMWRRLESEGVVRGFEAQERRKDGSTFWTSETLRAVRDAQGVTLYYEGIIEDITERKSLEEQLRQAQKMEAVGRLAGGVAHDFNNLLTIIISYSQLLRDMTGSNPLLVEKVDQISKAGARASNLTRQLLAFSRRQILQPRVLNLDDVLSDMGKMLQRLVSEDIELTIAHNPCLHPIRCDVGQIEQVIMNLVINARDAMPDGGKLTLQTANILLNGELTQRHPEAKSGPHVCLSVSDTGCGMDAETQAHVFEPFFTTKEEGRGTGLGLATVYGIVEQAGGYVDLHSEIGRGTTFHVYLPRAEGPIVEEKRPLVVSPEHGSETVLVVEDQDAVRELVCEILRMSGYEVVSARNGPEALQLSKKSNQAFDLMISDVVMPQMGGPELAKVLVRSRPDMKILYMTGYFDKGISPDELSRLAIIQKPFSPEALTQKVREVLDAPKNSTTEALRTK